MKAPKYRKYIPKKILKQFNTENKYSQSIMATLETVPKKEHCRMVDVYINVTLIEMTLQTYKNTPSNVLFFLQVSQVVKSI